VTLVDTSVWVDHLRRGSRALAERLERGEVLVHSHVIGELSCGHLRQRQEILMLLSMLPPAHQVEDDEALAFLETHRLFGRGIGWVDVHLLASATLSGAALWTLDQPLARAAATLRLPTH
jgi:predicted nucleic acid-binding protein